MAKSNEAFYRASYSFFLPMLKVSSNSSIVMTYYDLSGCNHFAYFKYSDWKDADQIVSPSSSSPSFGICDLVTNNFIPTFSFIPNTDNILFTDSYSVAAPPPLRIWDGSGDFIDCSSNTTTIFTKLYDIVFCETQPDASNNNYYVAFVGVRATTSIL